MAGLSPDSPSPEQSGYGARRPEDAVRTPDGTLYPEAPPRPPPIPDHELLHCIGRGSYGEVWLARNVLGEFRAVKIIDRLHFDSDHAYEREFEALKRYEPVSRGDPSQVAVLHVGRNDTAGFYYYIMELADAFESPKAEARSPTRCEGATLRRDEGQTPKSKAAASGSEIRASSLGVSWAFEPRSWGSYRPHTLREDLKNYGRLLVDECIKVGISLGTALEHLHGHGLIHRDIKPSNVIFVNGVPKLADIGLVARIDATLSFVGTEGYIPPEGPGTPQADLYSLGKVLYEISSGKDRTAFPEPLTRMGEEPDKARLLELNAVIHKACHTDPRQRYASAAEMRVDLELLKRGSSVRRRHLVQHRRMIVSRIAKAVVAAAGVGLAGYWAYHHLLNPQEMVPASKDHPLAVPLKASVFVLPFRIVGPNAIPVDLDSRVTDAFIDSLALIEGVRRSPRKSGWRWQDEDQVRHAVVRTNNTRHVLTGRIATSNDTLALTVRLFQRSSDQPLWTESFFGKTNELIALEQRALQTLVIRLGLSITAEEQSRIGALLTNNLEAFGWYQRAQEAYARKAGTQSGYKEVRELAQKAMELDSGRRYLEADVLDAYMLRNLAQDRAPSDVWPDVQRRMLSVLEQDDTFPAALEHLAGYALCYAKDWEGCYRFWNQELLYAPDWLWVKAFWLRYYGWTNEARICQERSEQPEPTNPDQRFGMASSRWVERHYAEGAQVARRTVQMYPGNAEGYQWLAHCLVANGEYLEGIEATYRAQEVWKKQEMTALRAVAYAKMGQLNEARQVLQELLQIQHTGPYLQFYFVARVYSALNEKEKALDWLEKAEQDHSEYLVLGDFGGGLRTDPMWDDYQEEPRFKALLKKVGLDQWPRPKPKLALGKQF
jgi:serine/threonine protein kinase